MKLLEERIKKDGQVRPGNILKVDGFLNHQIDPVLYGEIADEIYRLFEGEKIDKIVTIEASGIGIAVMTAAKFGVPALFAKKAKSANIDNDLFVSEVKSYTYGNTYRITVSKKYLHEGENILIVDDFLAKGNALKGLIDIMGQAGANVVGAAICVEKEFQNGGNDLRAQGIRVESLAKIASMSDTDITFMD